jgi:chromosomal replication initiation ATPase DnaA
MTQQTAFDFQIEENYSVNNFIVFSGNMEAFCMLNRTGDERNDLDSQIVFLSGEEKCGKTHLGQIWKNNHNAKTIEMSALIGLEFEELVPRVGSIIEKLDYYLIDDFPEDIEEDRFFYLLNTVLVNNSSALIISRGDMSRKHRSMKDLESRIRGGMSLRIGKLTRDAKPMLINKLFADKQIFVNGDVLKYLNGKLSTNYREVYSLVSRIILRMSENGQKLTTGFLRTILKEKPSNLY